MVINHLQVLGWSSKLALSQEKSIIKNKPLGLCFYNPPKETSNRKPYKYRVSFNKKQQQNMAKLKKTLLQIRWL